ncbi:3-dehydroquinate synthase [Helicobacter cynogastricus]|uniref:3-dehydroquinate synthase n=1 Tax=Helicobacter cynogastricus TaxID=329937 RepID=UPI000CF04AAD|nr:3-dehydroquinate synthase [Helicobacter cynogastricus]
MMCLEITTRQGSYFVHLGDLPQITLDCRVLVVSDTQVGQLYLNSFLDHLEATHISTHLVPVGEAFKNWESVESILEAGFRARLGRQDCMIALGGGVVSDMVGFASAIYKRGIDFYNVPTTLLAQVDASVGGKTGINNAHGKNLIGAFHAPKGVYIDPVFLKSLEARAFKAGVAEMIKKAICLDASYFEWLHTHPIKTHLLEAIFKSVQIKARVVEADEHEKGLRMGLNYGHTFAHAIEKEGDYSQLLHGEAVGIGMRMANALALELGLLDPTAHTRVETLLRAYGLDLSYKIKNMDMFYATMQQDKKNSAGVRFILPTGIGSFEMVDDVPKNVVYEVLRIWA